MDNLVYCASRVCPSDALALDIIRSNAFQEKMLG